MLVMTRGVSTAFCTPMRSAKAWGEGREEGRHAAKDTAPIAAIAQNARRHPGKCCCENVIPSIIGAPAPEPEAVTARNGGYFRVSRRSSITNVQPFGAAFFCAFLTI